MMRPLLVLCLLLPACATQGMAADAAAPGKAVAVRTHTVQRDTTAPAVQAIGQLVADEMVMIRAEIPGRIEKLHFTEGARVSLGQVLVTLDSAEQRARLAQLQAEARLADERHHRAEALHAQGFLAEQNIIESREVRHQMQARVAEAEAQLSKMTLRAPFSGVAGLRLVSAGAYLKEGDDIVTLSKVDQLKLDIRLPERHLPVVSRTSVVQAEVDAWPVHRFPARIQAVDPNVDPVTRTVLVRARVANPQGRLQPGMFVRALISLPVSEHHVRVPEDALTPKGGRQLVYRVRKGRAEAVAVTPVRREPGWVEITGGIQAGDVIIVDGQLRLQPGNAVTPIAGGNR